ncbi:uncharacterized protein LOC129216335 [Uloborus diversus]|uniref:uncharacterized protein LOC129216335 n=1 Tax=Uloborus diversus TaxID=327109 RepID=UPI002409F56A|nr:uncharacterized protein LOC129216335 [Uloborus diversus]
MENLVKKRSPLRTSFTKTYMNLMALFENENIAISDLKIKLATLERINAGLMTLDNEILELTLNADDDGKSYTVEFEAIEEYKIKFDEALVYVNSFLESKSQISASINNEKSQLKLPKLELMKFGGEVKDWLCFWSQFKRIHEHKQMEEGDKFQYFIQCMSPGTRAKEINDSYPPTAENYEKAIESLKARFGREELLVEYYVRELLTLVVKNATKSKLNITQLYDKLESHLRSLESIGMTCDKYAAMLFPLVESCVPEDILRVWLRNSASEEKSYSARLNQLLNFLRTEVEGEERITLAKSG